MRVDPADRAGFSADLKSLAVATCGSEGNSSYDAALDDPGDSRLLIVERWADQAALTAHFEAEDTLAFVSCWQGRMWGDIGKYDASNERRHAED